MGESEDGAAGSSASQALSDPAAACAPGHLTLLFHLCGSICVQGERCLPCGIIGWLNMQIPGTEARAREVLSKLKGK